MCYLNPTIPANKNRFFYTKKMDYSRIKSYKYKTDIFLYISIIRCFSLY